MPMTHDPDLHQTTLPNGVRVVAMAQPHLHSAAVSVFVGSGSAHESATNNGISHFVEHMVFKGTLRRDVAQINRDAEALGAELNAHTDKDHTAYHLVGLGEHAPRFVHLLADLVVCPTFPEAELARERQVLLDEHAEVEDDTGNAAWRLFDRACYGLHPLAQPVMGSRAVTERMSAAALRQWVARHHVGGNVVVVAAGGLDPAAVLEQARADFAALPAGRPAAPAPAVWQGGLRSRSVSDSAQTQLILGWPLPPLAADDPVGELAAALFGEGMSSPLLAQLRERQGWVYYANAAADHSRLAGEFVVEASFAPQRLEPVLAEVARLLAVQAKQVDADEMERARQQVLVRWKRGLDSPSRRGENAALELLALGRLRPLPQRLAQLQAVDAQALRARFVAWLAQPVALALGGRVPRGARERCRQLLGQQGLRLA
ncbi:putative Zn-dependent peptidase [Burkholderiales bacterium JOSHI_001]|nr:putative Zn-dependent peptidase [Burkholderiales bacterium JOSHI_001]